MAHPNIDERRYYVAQLLEKGISIDVATKKNIAEIFNCHVSAIYADCKHFEKHGWHWELHYGRNRFGTEYLIIEPVRYTIEQFRQGVVQLPFDTQLLSYLDAHPDEIFRLPPRGFEELVAGLLEKFGYRVRLPPVGPDGGVDVFAERIGICGPELTLVQCKRYQEDRKVGRPVIQQLNANTFDHGANLGLVVTTSYFTRPALDYIEQSRYRLRGADRLQLQDWIKHHAQQK